MTITVTVTNPRHLAAANIIYQASIPIQPELPTDPIPIPYADVTECVQAAMNRVLDSWVETTQIDVISVASFILRFTPTEFSTITADEGTNPYIAAILTTLRGRQTVRLGSVDAINGLAYLVSQGYVTQERSDAILAY